MLSVDTIDSSDNTNLYNNSMSNPDLLRDNSTTAPSVEASDSRTEYPEHVLKVYKSDQV